MADHAPKPGAKSLGDTRNDNFFRLFRAQSDRRGAHSFNQIEAARKVLSRASGKTGKVWIRIFPDMPTPESRPRSNLAKARQLEGYVAPVLEGRIIFEVDGVTEAVAGEALRKAGTKLPVKTKIMAR